MIKLIKAVYWERGGGEENKIITKYYKKRGEMGWKEF